MKNWIKPIKLMGACLEACEWANKYDTFEEVWNICEHGEWMLWLLGKLSGEPETDSRRKLVLTTCQCARLALPYVKKGKNRALKAIETCEAWANGDELVKLEDVRNAADAAADAACAAAAYAAFAAADAAFAAADAAYAAYAAYAAAAYAAHAAYAPAYTAAYAAFAAANAAFAAKESILRQCADIIRKNYKAEDIVF